ncbi:MAG: hydrogenase expression/formation protein HypE [Bacteroidota bacterium]
MTSLSCPIPLSEYSKILLAHGGGGKLTQHLIQKMFVPAFQNPILEPLHDGAVLNINGGRLAFTTDSYVVNPLFFPGGNIGDLAINGTVNDLAMCGAKPLYLSAGFIIEEGFPLDELWQVVCAMEQAAKKAEVLVVTGDTKVVEKGKGDKLFINTSGIGVIKDGIHIHPSRICNGDKIIINGGIGDHGIAILSKRQGLEFESALISDTAALNGIVSSILGITSEIHMMRDPTRGGIASVMNEIAGQAGKGILLDENAIPVSEPVRGACEILGFDPLYIANEGKCVVFVEAKVADKVLATMQAHPLGKNAAIIGEVVSDHPGIVVLKTGIGSKRIVDMISGEQLPRIC